MQSIIVKSHTRLNYCSCLFQRTWNNSSQSVASSSLHLALPHLRQEAGAVNQFCFRHLTSISHVLGEWHHLFLWCYVEAAEMDGCHLRRVEGISYQGHCFSKNALDWSLCATWRCGGDFETCLTSSNFVCLIQTIMKNLFFYDFGSATPVVVAMFPKLSRREYLVFKLQTLWKGDRCGRLNALTVKLCQLDKQSLQPRAFVRASLSRWSICSSWEA